MGKKVTVLVVEDEVLILLDIVDYLESEGFRVCLLYTSPSPRDS